jgi:hypothetical protein
MKILVISEARIAPVTSKRPASASTGPRRIEGVSDGDQQQVEDAGGENVADRQLETFSRRAAMIEFSSGRDVAKPISTNPTMPAASPVVVAIASSVIERMKAGSADKDRAEADIER